MTPKSYFTRQKNEIRRAVTPKSYFSRHGTHNMIHTANPINWRENNNEKISVNNNFRNLEYKKKSRFFEERDRPAFQDNNELMYLSSSYSRPTIGLDIEEPYIHQTYQDEASPQNLYQSYNRRGFSRINRRGFYRRIEKSPLVRSESVESPKRRRKPGELMRTPKRLERSLKRIPQRLEITPKRIGRSPQRLEKSPERLERSPQRLEGNPNRLERSPQRRERSPERFERSPKRIPQKVDRTPKRLNRSPQRFERIPKRTPERLERRSQIYRREGGNKNNLWSKKSLREENEFKTPKNHSELTKIKKTTQTPLMATGIDIDDEEFEKNIAEHPHFNFKNLRSINPGIESEEDYGNAKLYEGNKENSFIGKISKEEYKRGVGNGFRRYMYDCSKHLDTAFGLRKDKNTRRMEPPIPIYLQEGNYFSKKVIN